MFLLGCQTSCTRIVEFEFCLMAYHPLWVIYHTQKKLDLLCCMKVFMIAFDYIWSDFDEKVFFKKKTQDVLWFGVFKKILQGACLVVFWASLSETVTV